MLRDNCFRNVFRATVTPFFIYFRGLFFCCYTGAVVLGKLHHCCVFYGTQNKTTTTVKMGTLLGRISFHLSFFCVFSFRLNESLKNGCLFFQLTWLINCSLRLKVSVVHGLTVDLVKKIH